MDVHIQEFGNWLRSRGAEEEKVSAILDFEGDLPSLKSCTDSETSSLEDCSVALSSDAYDDEDGLIDDDETVELSELRTTRKTVKRISFQEEVEVREYAVTIGDHPSCNDSCPLALDWYHSEDEITRKLDDSKEREGKYEMPKRLTFNERRRRLFVASAFGSERVQNQELDRVIEMLHKSWAEPKILPPPVLEDEINMEDDEEEKDKAEEPQVPVLRWKRVSLTRQKAFGP